MRTSPHECYENYVVTGQVLLSVPKVQELRLDSAEAGTGARESRGMRLTKHWA